MSIVIERREGIEQAIYKYIMTRPDGTFVELPKSAVALTAGVQMTDFGPVIVIWIATAPFEDLAETRCYIAINTGVTLPEHNLLYIATVTTESNIVWHIFEDLDRRATSG